MVPRDETLVALLKHYPASPHALWRSCEAKLLKRTQINRPMLDLACGDGKFSSAVFDIIDAGLDNDVRSITKAKCCEKYKSLILGDAAHMPFKSGTFNSVVSNSALEHMKSVDEVLREVRRILSAQGIFLFTVVTEDFEDMLIMRRLGRRLNRYWMARKDWRIVNAHSIENWCERLRAMGLDVSQAVTYAGPLTVLLFDILDWIYRIPILPYPLVRIGQVVEKIYLKSDWMRSRFLIVFDYLIKRPCKKTAGGLFIRAQVG